eukprot:Em0010g953a
MTSLISTLCRYATHKNIHIGDYNIHDCDVKPTKDEVKMASQVLSKLAATSPDKTISIPTDGLVCPPGLHMTQGIFMKVFSLLEDACHSYDMQLAFINQTTNSTSSFSAYCVELHKLQMLKAKYAECKAELADLEEVMTSVAVCLGKDDSITNNFIKQVNEKKRSVQQMEKEIAHQSNAVEKGFKKHEGPFVQGLDTALQSFKVKRQQYFGGVFVGNHIHKALKPSNISIMCSSMIQVAHEKCPTLVETVSATAEKFTTVFSLLGRCHSIYDQLFIDELKVTELEHAISEFMENFRASFPSSSISLKMHLLEDHTVPWAKRTGTGFGLLGEQGAESIHARFNTLQRTYQCIHNKVDRLLSFVKEHSLSISPRIVESIPPPNKRAKSATVMMLLAVMDPAGHVSVGCEGSKEDGIGTRFSRKIIWLELTSTNNDPQVAASFYLDALLKLKGCPSRMRSDHGTENTIIALCQMVLRHNHTDHHAGCNSFVFGSSVRNTRIESWWSRLRAFKTSWWIDLFKSLVEDGFYDPTITLQRHIAAYVFEPLLRKELHEFKERWNQHRIWYNRRAVRAAVRRFINEVDQEEREPISKKKVSTIEGLCAAYQDSVKNKRTGDPSGSNAAKRSREEKENGKMFGMNVCRMKKNKSDGYKRQGEVHRVSGFMHEDNYDTTLRKAVAPLLDKAANYNKCHLVMAGGRVSNLPLISKQRPWSLGGFMEELGGFEKGKRLVIGVYVPNDDTTITDHSDKDILISPPRARKSRTCNPTADHHIDLCAHEESASSEPSQALNLPKPARERLNELDLTEDGLLVPLEKIEIGAKIGGGTFGSVHKGMLFGTDVAIKIVTIPEGDVKREAMKEVEILKKLRHPNIVNLMGVCYEVTSSDLHVFVCDLGVAKLQSKLAIHKTSRGPGAGTVAYKAPEMFRDSRRSTPVDIYSFGCVIIELFTGKRVWGELDTCQITCKILGTREDDPQTPSCEEVPEEHREICARSTALDGSDRPSAQEMLEYFKLQ